MGSSLASVLAGGATGESAKPERKVGCLLEAKRVRHGLDGAGAAREQEARSFQSATLVVSPQTEPMVPEEQAVEVGRAELGDLAQPAKWQRGVTGAFLNQSLHAIEPSVHRRRGGVDTAGAFVQRAAHANPGEGGLLQTEKGRQRGRLLHVIAVDPREDAPGRAQQPTSLPFEGRVTGGADNQGFVPLEQISSVRPPTDHVKGQDVGILAERLLIKVGRREHPFARPRLPAATPPAEHGPSAADQPSTLSIPRITAMLAVLGRHAPVVDPEKLGAQRGPGVERSRAERGFGTHAENR